MEQNWIVRLKAGDIAALQEIMQICTSYVYTILRNISRNKLSKEDLEELTADVFVQLWRSRTRLSEDMPLSPYLAAIARNCAKNRFRALGKQPPNRQSIEDLLIPDDTDLCQTAEQTEALGCLVRGLDTLPPLDRELVIRFYFYGEKTSEIAKALHLTDTSVRVRLHRCRGKLRKFMIERGFDHAE